MKQKVRLSGVLLAAGFVFAGGAALYGTGSLERTKTVSAADTDYVAQVQFGDSDPVKYKTIDDAFKELRSHSSTVDAPAVITLLSDVMAESKLTVARGTDSDQRPLSAYAILDLNDKVLTLPASSGSRSNNARLVVDAYSTLEIRDTAAKKTKRFFRDSDGDGVMEYAADEAEGYEVAGGVITGGVNNYNGPLVTCEEVSSTETSIKKVDNNGVILVKNKLVMNGGAIVGNKTASGGCVQLLKERTSLWEGSSTTSKYEQCSDPSFVMNKGVIAGNASAEGGAVYVSGGTFTMNGGTIEQNVAANKNAEVYVSSYDGGAFATNSEWNASFLMHGGSISASGTAAAFSIDSGTGKRAKAEIHGGKMNGDIEAEKPSLLTVYGGRFSADVGDYVAPNCTVAQGSNGTYGVYDGEVSAENYEITVSDAIVYDGKPVAAGVDFSLQNVPFGVTVTYSYTDKNNAALKGEGLPSDAGEYVVTASFSAYQTEKGYYAERTMEFPLAIGRATLTDATIEKNCAVEYDGKAHAFYVTLAGFADGEDAENAKDLKIEYTVDLFVPDSWTTAVYTATDVSDSKTVYFRVTSANYNDLTGSHLMRIEPKIDVSGDTPVIEGGSSEGVTYHFTGKTSDGAVYDSDVIPKAPGKYTVQITTPSAQYDVDFLIPQPLNITAIVIGVGVGAVALIFCIVVLVVAIKKRKRDKAAAEETER